MGHKRTVKEGEWLATLAYKEGFKDDGQRIWADSNNAKVKKEHPNSNLICNHHRLFIPDRVPKSLDAGTDERHTYITKSPKLLLRIKLLDAKNQPIKDEDYTLSIGDKTFSSKTSGGLVSETIPITSEKGYLELTTSNIKIGISLGYLKEIEPKCSKSKSCSLKGAQARLNNLGFNAGTVDGIAGRRTKDATWLFQAYCEKHSATLGFDSGPVDGIIGPLTRGALKKFHNT